MNLKLRNPLQGSMDPWPLATRLSKFVATVGALLFLHIYTRTFESVVRHNTGFTDPLALPERPRRIASRLCMASTGFLFLAIGFAFEKRYDTIWALVVAVSLCALCGWFLRRTAWGLANAFRLPVGRFEEAVRRFLRVIWHGHP